MTLGGHAGVPVELKASAFDVQATFRDRLSVETRTQTMPFFKEGMRVDEKIRQQLLNLASAGNSQVLAPLVSNIFDDTSNLLRGARVVRERMAMGVVAIVGIVIGHKALVGGETEEGVVAELLAATCEVNAVVVGVAGVTEGLRDPVDVGEIVGIVATGVEGCELLVGVARSLRLSKCLRPL